MVWLTFSLTLVCVALVWWWARHGEKRRLAAWRESADQTNWSFFEIDQDLHWTLSAYLVGDPVRWSARPGIRGTYQGLEATIFDLEFTVPYAHGHKTYRQTAVLLTGLAKRLPPLDITPIGLSFRMRSKEEIDAAREGLPRLFWERYVLESPDLEEVKARLKPPFFDLFMDTWRQHCHGRPGGFLWFKRDVVWPTTQVDAALEQAAEMAATLTAGWDEAADSVQ